jgi:ActR/RegA family two-component response regulator
MLGYDPERVEVLLYQLVHLTRGGQQAKMSKRRGDVVFLEEFMDDVGVDAARWFLVNRGPDQTIDIDVDLAAERSEKNPVYYVQYAHARIAGIEVIVVTGYSSLDSAIKGLRHGVFDYIVFRVNGGTVYLAGYSFEGRLKADAEMAAKRANGVVEVGNKIEVLPTSQNDHRIRWATYYRIYSDDFLSRYAPGGVYGVLQELRDERHFPGMQPVGRYPIHIIVKNGRTMLLGIVDHASDRLLAEVRAREVTGVFEVENSLIVAREAEERSVK